MVCARTHEPSHFRVAHFHRDLAPDHLMPAIALSHFALCELHESKTSKFLLRAHIFRAGASFVEATFFIGTALGAVTAGPDVCCNRLVFLIECSLKMTDLFCADSSMFRTCWVIVTLFSS